MRRLVYFEVYNFSYKYQQALNIAVTILHTTCRLHGQKNHILRNILKFQNVKFECFLILNENIRIWDKGSIYFQLRLDKYKMIAKMLWALMKPRSRHNSTKKNALRFFFFTVTLLPFTQYHSLPCLPLRNITKTLRSTHPLCVT